MNFNFNFNSNGRRTKIGFLLLFVFIIFGTILPAYKLHRTFLRPYLTIATAGNSYEHEQAHSHEGNVNVNVTDTHTTTDSGEKKDDDVDADDGDGSGNGSGSGSGNGNGQETTNKNGSAAEEKDGGANADEIEIHTSPSTEDNDNHDDANDNDNGNAEGGDEDMDKDKQKEKEREVVDHRNNDAQEEEDNSNSNGNGDDKKDDEGTGTGKSQEGPEEYDKPLAPHPHAGARYPDGRYGYVADVTAVRKQHFQMLEEWKSKKARSDSESESGNKSRNEEKEKWRLGSSPSPSPSPAKNFDDHVDEDNNDDDTNLELDGNTFASYRMRSTFSEEIYTYACNNTPGQGFEGEEGFKLMQKVQIGGPTPQPDPSTLNVTSTTSTRTASHSHSNNTNNNTMHTIAGRRRMEEKYDGQDVEKEEAEAEKEEYQLSKARILCVIYTHEPHHTTMLQAVVNTWAWKCDGFFAASTVTNETLGAVNLAHLGEESYNNMWQKSRSIWSYIHDNYVHDFDYFWLGGDDFLLYVENLRGILADHTIDSNPANANENGIPVYLGHQIPSMGDTYFCGGGPGYVLNQVAVKRLVAEVLPTCRAEKIISAEDRMMSNCLREIGILCGNVADAKGRQRFWGMDPNLSATLRGDTGYFERVYEFWGKMNGGFKWGIDLASEQLSGFHNLRYPEFMHRIHALQYPGTCPSNSIVGQALRKQRRVQVLIHKNP